MNEMNERMKERQTNDRLMEMTKQNSEKISQDLSKIIGRLDAIQGVRS